MITELLTLPYMTAFRCVGGSCPDSCCIGWEIWIEEPQYLALRERLSSSDEDRALFARGLIVPEQPTGNAQEFARFRLREDGRCTFLDDDGLCVIERRFGAAALGAVCRLHPRRIRKRGSRMELTATLSCPEAARLCLAQSNPAPVVRALTDSGIASGDEPDPADVYRAAETIVRDAALSLLRDDRFPVPERLQRTLALAERLEPIYHRGCTTPLDRIREALSAPNERQGQVPVDWLDRHQLNYAVNHWVHESFVDGPSVLPYVRALLERLARHRALAEHADEATSVTIVAALTRRFEHHQEATASSTRSSG